MAHADASRRNPQQRGHFLVAHLLQIPHHQNLAVSVVKRFERGLNSSQQLLADRPVGRTGMIGGQDSRQFDGRMVGKLGCLSLFPSDTPPLGVDVPSIELNQPLPGHPSQPRIKRDRLFPRVLDQFPRRFRERVLHDVRRIEANRHPAIHMHGDHPPKPVAMLLQQGIDGRTIGVGGSQQECFGVGVGGGHAKISAFIV